jgi:hypothetical protein
MNLVRSGQREGAIGELNMCYTTKEKAKTLADGIANAGWNKEEKNELKNPNTSDKL